MPRKSSRIEKNSDLKIDPEFKWPKGFLALKHGNIIYKFCSQCGDYMRGDNAALLIHCKNNHDSQDHEFLVYGSLPIDSKWKNFKEYLANPSIDLICKEGREKNKGGRPRKESGHSLH